MNALRGRLGLFGALAIAVGAIALPAAARQDQGAVEKENLRCLNCHGRPEIAEYTSEQRRLMLAPGGDPAAAPAGATDVRPGLYVRPDILSDSTIHAGLRCVDCHPDTEILPHAPTLEPPSCSRTCHAAEWEVFGRSVHGAALTIGDPEAPNCWTCHAEHLIAPVDYREASTHPFNIIKVCGDCHQHHATATTNGHDPVTHIQSYLDSVHGRALTDSGLIAAATCADCHGHHGVLPAYNPDSLMHRDRIPETCGTCHLGVVEEYAKSVHGQFLEAGDERAPVCTDCHTAHAITDSATPDFMRDIVNECGTCHDRQEMSKGRRATFYRTYRASYHGQVNKLGSNRAARCSDCHGAHDILPIDDPASRLYGDNLLVTCRTCHEGAPASLAQFDPHADYLDRARYPLLNAVWWYFVFVIGSAMGFFGLHSLLWFLRSAFERARNGAEHPPAVPAGAVRRFTRLNRINHGLLIITFFGLTLTGLPLLFSDQDWTRTVSDFIGGGHVLGILHRTFAVALLLNFILHIAGLVHKARHHHGSGGLLRDWVIGPNTMLPRWKDVTDCLGMFRWFVFGGKKPHFDRWTYWEKFDYLAEIFGTVVIGGTGLLLWFPIFFANLVPGWMFNVASIVHGYEALLAVSFIFTIHFFNAHLRVEKFPVDDVIFTGRLSEEELAHERPAEYERLLATGEIEELRVAPAPAWQRPAAIAIGIIAMLIGFTTVVFIILAGIHVFSGHLV